MNVILKAARRAGWMTLRACGIAICALLSLAIYGVLMLALTKLLYAQLHHRTSITESGALGIAATIMTVCTAILLYFASAFLLQYSELRRRRSDPPD